MTRDGIAKLFANGCKEQWVVWSGGHLKGIAIPKIVGIRSGVAVVVGGHLISAGAEDCVDLVVSGKEPLGLPW